MSSNRRMFSLLLTAATAAIGYGDDGWIGNSGSPRLMKGHSSVRMQSERVVMTLGKKLTRVSASFRFVNTGPATTVRMGFPDSGDSEGEGPTPVIKHFESWVGDRRVHTEHLKGGNEMWYVKTVHFPAHSVVWMLDRYSVRTGVQDWGWVSCYQVAAYEFDTGASWVGKIHRAEVVVRFGPDVPRPTHLVDDYHWFDSWEGDP